MENNLFITTMASVYNFSKLQVEYADFTKRMQGGVGPAQLVEIQDAANKRVESLENLKKEIMKLEKKIHPDRYQEIFRCVEAELTLASMLATDCSEYLSTQDPKYLDSVMEGLTTEKEYSAKLDASFSMLERQIGTIMAYKALSGEMSLDEIRDFSMSLEKNTPLQKNMEELVHTLERRSIKTNEVTHEEQKPLEPEREEEKQKTQEKEIRKPTFQERLDQINYTLGGNLVSEVQELTAEESLLQIQKQITLLESKEKLSLKDMIQLQSLKETQLEMEAYADSLGEQKLSLGERNRDNKMASATHKIEETSQLLEQSRQNYQAYNSKIMRFFSMRYQEQLQVNIERLKEKRGTLQTQQKISAVAKFNKNSGKIARRSRVLGTVRGLSQFRDAKIEELKAFREQVVTEFTSLQQDIQRFQSERGMLPTLQQSPIIMPDNVISLEEHRALQNNLVA